MRMCMKMEHCIELKITYSRNFFYMDNNNQTAYAMMVKKKEYEKRIK